MKKLFLLFTGIFLLSSSYTVLSIENDFKFSVKRKVNDISLLGEIDYRRDEGDLFRRHYDLGLRMPINFLGDGWSFGAHYRSVYTSSDDGGWSLEKRPHFQIQKTFSTSETGWLPELKWGLRTRQEFRFRENKKNSSRNRIRIRISSEKSFYNLKPFISNELYYDFNKGNYSKIRFDIGVEFPKTKYVKPSLSYKFVLNHGDDEWESNSSLVFKLAF